MRWCLSSVLSSFAVTKENSRLRDAAEYLPKVCLTRSQRALKSDGTDLTINGTQSSKTFETNWPGRSMSSEEAPVRTLLSFAIRCCPLSASSMAFCTTVSYFLDSSSLLMTAKKTEKALVNDPAFLSSSMMTCSQKSTLQAKISCFGVHQVDRASECSNSHYSCKTSRIPLRRCPAWRGHGSTSKCLSTKTRRRQQHRWASIMPSSVVTAQLR